MVAPHGVQLRDFSFEAAQVALTLVEISGAELAEEPDLAGLGAAEPQVLKGAAAEAIAALKPGEGGRQVAPGHFQRDEAAGVLDGGVDGESPIHHMR